MAKEIIFKSDKDEEYRFTLKVFATAEGHIRVYITDEEDIISTAWVSLDIDTAKELIKELQKEIKLIN